MADLPKDKIIEILVDYNTDKSERATCASGVACPNINCRQCPLSNTDVTIGDIRVLDTRDTRVKPKPVPPAEAPQDIEGVRTPSHYMLFDDIEAIEVIARSMSVEQFKGYCFGNILKYRLRAGKKSELAFLEKDLAKAEFYGELFEQHKGKCYA
ncbi:nucleotide kinase [Pectobacterium phage PcCB251]|uniref:Nucleotide kinase n=1 Tax=Pectobacterium phage PcCB251 TaxID=2798045 RepID=A0AAE7P4U8_9CAUD|nr:nucleotide kinase [Pectobacterium phage PcCB251]